MKCTQLLSKSGHELQPKRNHARYRQCCRVSLQYVHNISLVYIACSDDISYWQRNSIFFMSLCRQRGGEIYAKVILIYELVILCYAVVYTSICRLSVSIDLGCLCKSVSRLPTLVISVDTNSENQQLDSAACSQTWHLLDELSLSDCYAAGLRTTA